MVSIQWYILKVPPMQLPPMMISTQNLQSLHNRSNRQFAIQKKTKIVEVAKSKFLSHELPPILTPLPCAIFLPKTPFLLTTVILREKTNATTIVSVYVLDRQTQGHLEIKIVSLLFNQCKKYIQNRMEGLSLLLESFSNCISPLSNLSIPTDLFRRKAT